MRLSQRNIVISTVTLTHRRGGMESLDSTVIWALVGHRQLELMNNVSLRGPL